jgi:DMSO/TMAO reductase YedYZ molybdopterin-dependent catalytic subunit
VKYCKQERNSLVQHEHQSIYKGRVYVGGIWHETSYLNSVIFNKKEKRGLAGEITNLSCTTINLSQEDLQYMPKTTVYAELYCDGSLATYGNWTGILLSDLLIKAQLTPEGSSIQFTASDGYKVTIPIELAMQPQTIIAYQKDGRPIVEDLRLILVGTNGGTWISLITTIEMSSSEADYPPGVNVDSGKINDLASAQNSPTPGMLSPQQQSIPKNFSRIQISSLTNVTGSNQAISKPRLSSNVGMSLDALIYGAGAIVLMIVVFAVVLTHKRKGKLQNAI